MYYAEKMFLSKTKQIYGRTSQKPSENVSICY